MMCDESKFKDCKTGIEIESRVRYLHALQEQDLQAEKEKYESLCILALMMHYCMPYRYAAQEFYQHGMLQMGLGVKT